MDAEDDMFSDAFTTGASVAPAAIIGREFVDDSEGFFVVRPGDVLDTPMGRFRVDGLLGKGMYGAVYKGSLVIAKTGEHDLGRLQAIALKIHRANPLMYRAGMKEVEILQKIKETESPHETDRFIVGFLGRFDLYKHNCLAYELLEMSARELLERYGGGKGISLKAVQVYARQMCAALHLLYRCRIIHGDIKPENILITSQLNIAKLCDFGTAMKSPCTDFMPYLASRFYRSPEVILGCPVGCETDVWSLGCTLYELYTGQVLFSGHSNAEMLLLMTQSLGRLPAKMVKSAQARRYFPDGIGNRLHLEIRETGVKRQEHVSPIPQNPISGLLKPILTLEEDETLCTKFIDFIEQLVVLPPDRRLSPTAALSHPFLK